MFGAALEPGDVFHHQMPAGGGFGDPLERDPEAVAERRARGQGLARARRASGTASSSARTAASTPPRRRSSARLAPRGRSAREGRPRRGDAARDPARAGVPLVGRHAARRQPRPLRGAHRRRRRRLRRVDLRGPGRGRLLRAADGAALRRPRASRTSRRCCATSGPRGAGASGRSSRSSPWPGSRSRAGTRSGAPSACRRARSSAAACATRSTSSASSRATRRSSSPRMPASSRRAGTTCCTSSSGAPRGTTRSAWRRSARRSAPSRLPPRRPERGVVGRRRRSSGSGGSSSTASTGSSSRRPSGDVPGLAHVRRSVGVKIAADQAVFTTRQLLEVLRHEAADVVVQGSHDAGGLLPLSPAGDDRGGARRRRQPTRVHGDGDQLPRERRRSPRRSRT